MKRQLPDASIFLDCRTADERLWFLYVEGDVDRGAYYMFDRKTGKVEFVRLAQPGFPGRTPIAHEGDQVQGARRDVHSRVLGSSQRDCREELAGRNSSSRRPMGSDEWRYQGWAQFLANRGYAVLLPNFRGSTGYGKRFLNAEKQAMGHRLYAA